MPRGLALSVGAVNEANGPASKKEGKRLAFVILSTGALTESRLHTIGARTLALCIGVAMLCTLGAGLGLGYRLGESNAARNAVQPAPLRLHEPEGRVLVDRVGALSGRLNRLESEAAILARQLGVTPEFESSLERDEHVLAGAESDDALAASTSEPSGGPLLPVSEFAAVSVLESDLDRLESAVALVADAANHRSVESMAVPSHLPLAGRGINSGFGVRRDPMTGRLARHTGIDMAAPWGTPIRASAGGRVRLAGRSGPYGYVVEIDHGNGLVTRYAHASRLYVRAGDLVMPQQTIAAVGSTGRSTGPHLHFEVIRNGVRVEPRNYLARNGS